MAALANLYIYNSETTALPSSLVQGQLAWSGNGGILYIGANAVVVPIGGARTPGTLTANQALVANATSYLNQIKTAKLFLTDTTANVTHINSVANATHLGAAVNTEVTTTWAIKTYVDAKVGAATGVPGGSNTYVQFNDSTTFGGVSGFTFDKDSNTLTVSNSTNIGANVKLGTVALSIGNSTVNNSVNSVMMTVANSTLTTSYGIGGANVGANVRLTEVFLFAGNTTANLIANSVVVQVSNASAVSNLQPTQLLVGANVQLTTVQLNIGNSTANTFANSILVKVANSTGIANLQPTQLLIGTSTLNATSLALGANVLLDTVAISVGNSTANIFANSILVTVANSTATANLIPGRLVVGTQTVNTTAFAAGANVFLSTSALSIGNSTVNTFINSSSFATTGDISCRDASISGNLVVSGTVTTVSTVNLTVTDPLIKLAKDNDSTDAVDIGFYGLLDPTGSQDTYSGLFRDATDDKYKLFHLLQTEPTTTVDTGGTGYAPAWLVCYLESANVNITGGVVDCGTF